MQAGPSNSHDHKSHKNPFRCNFEGFKIQSSDKNLVHKIHFTVKLTTWEIWKEKLLQSIKIKIGPKSTHLIPDMLSLLVDMSTK